MPSIQDTLFEYRVILSMKLASLKFFIILLFHKIRNFLSAKYDRYVSVLHLGMRTQSCKWVDLEGHEWALHYLQGKQLSTVELNCWFCNENAHVHNEEKNGWTCPNCEQFNGFKLDGDYIQPIEGQYDIKDYKTQTFCTPEELNIASSVLCSTCSQHQVLKARQLAAFVPLNDETYDEEVDMYKDYLEHVYDLCKTCQTNVAAHLTAQDRKLQSSMKDFQRSQLEHLQYKDHRKNSPTMEQLPSCRPLFQTVIFCMNVVAALALFILNLRLYAGTATWTRNAVKPTYIHQGLNWLLRVFPANLALQGEIMVVYVGATLWMLTLFITGKHSLYPEDAVFSLLWVFSMIITSGIFANVLPWLHLTREVSTCVSLATLVVALVCCVRSRQPRYLTGYTMHKKYFSQKEPEKRKARENGGRADERIPRSIASEETLPHNSEPVRFQREGSAQCEHLRQDLESFSLGLNRKSGSSSSIWSLPAVVASSSEVLPDSSTDPQEARQPRSLLSPSRLGFLTFESWPPSRDSQQSFSRSPSPWNPITPGIDVPYSAVPQMRANAFSQPIQQDILSGMTPCVPSCNHPKVAPPLYLTMHRNLQYPVPQRGLSSWASEENLGPCDSQTKEINQPRLSGIVNSFSTDRARNNVAQSIRLHQQPMYGGQNLTAKEIAAVRQHYMRTKDNSSDSENKEPRRSQRIAGKSPKPWTLKKSLSCNNAYDKKNMEKAGTITRLRKCEASRVPEKIIEDVESSPWSKPFPEESVQCPQLKTKDLRSLKSSSFLRNSGLSEFSDNEGDHDFLLMNKRGMKRRNMAPLMEHGNDVSWKWILVGLVIGMSITTNVFLVAQSWLMQHGKT